MHHVTLCDFMNIVDEAVSHSVVVPLGEDRLSDLLENLYRGDAISPPVLMRLGEGRLRIVDGGGTILALRDLLKGCAGSVMFDPVTERFYPYGRGDAPFALHAAEICTAPPADLGRILGARNAGVLASSIAANVEKLRLIGARTVSYIELRQTDALDRIHGLWARFQSSGSRLSMARVSFFIDGADKTGTRQYRRLHCEIVPPHHPWFQIAA